MFNIIKSIYLNISFHYYNQPECYDNTLYIVFFDNINFTGITIYTKYKKVGFGMGFNQKLDNVQFCEGIENIYFGYSFNQSIETIKFPKTLKKIKLGPRFKQSLSNVKFPDGFEEIEFTGGYYKNTIDSLPINLLRLKVYNEGVPMTNLPVGLEEITFVCCKANSRANNFIHHKIPYGCIINFTEPISPIQF
jgi:hypothetical protein